MRHLFTARVALVIVSFAMPLALCALVACGVDGQTPDCSQPNSQCEPSAENKNADATLDAKDAADTSIKAETASDSTIDVDAGDAGDAADVRTDGDARVDGDAKAG